MKLHGKAPSWMNSSPRSPARLGGKVRAIARPSRELRDERIRADFRAAMRFLVSWIVLRALLGGIFGGWR
jgi:hypothetical protein